jgi:hypothetical protein
MEDILRGGRLKAFSRRWRRFFSKKGSDANLYGQRSSGELLEKKYSIQRIPLYQEGRKVIKQKIRDTIKNKVLIIMDQKSVRGLQVDYTNIKGCCSVWTMPQGYLHKVIQAIRELCKVRCVIYLDNLLRSRSAEKNYTPNYLIPTTSGLDCQFREIKPNPITSIQIPRWIWNSKESKEENLLQKKHSSDSIS